MAKYKHLSIPPEDFAVIEELKRRIDSENGTDISPPKIVIIAAKRVLADMDKTA